MEILLPVLCVIFTAGQALAGYQGTLVNAKDKWVRGRAACQRQNGVSCDLSQATQNDAEFWSSLGMKEGVPYWVGGKRMDILGWKDQERSVIEQYGCYAAAAGLKLKQQGKPNKYNNPERCLAKCSTNTVALKGETCYCLKEEDFDGLSQVTDGECHVLCPSKQTHHSRCGGEGDTYSVYNMPEHSLLEIRGKKTNFVFRRSNNNNKEFIVFSNANKNKAINMCSTIGGLYQYGPACQVDDTVSLMDMDLRNFLMETEYDEQMKGQDFNSKLSKFKMMLWVNGDPVSSAVADRKPCLAATWDGASVSLSSRKCNDRLPQVCSCYVEDPPTTFPPTTTMPETSTTPEPTTSATDPTTTTPEPTMPPTTPEPSTTTMEAMTTSTPEPTTSTTMEVMTTTTTAAMVTSWHYTSPSTVPVTGPPSSSPSSSSPALATGAVARDRSRDIVADSSTPSTTLALVYKSSSEPKPFGDNAPMDPGMSDKSVGTDDKDDVRPAGLGSGAVVGIVVAVLIIVVVAVVVVIVLHRRRTSSSTSLMKATPTTEAAPEKAETGMNGSNGANGGAPPPETNGETPAPPADGQTINPV